MAKNMGHEGTLTSTTVMLTTLLSAFTVTFWLFVLRSGGLI
jgi:predicted permease